MEKKDNINEMITPEECNYCYKELENNYKGYCSKRCFYRDMNTL